MIASSEEPWKPERRSDSPDDDVRELDELLRSVHFEPRASLEPELIGQLRRGERLKGDLPSGARWPLFVAGTLAVLIAVAGAALWGPTWVGAARGDVVVDRCCHDLDGGGPGDDGLLIVAGPREEVRRLSIYEDVDGSRSYSEPDVIRFVRGADPQVEGPFPPDLVTLQHCCVDFDGGGPADDGVLVVGSPPDRVVMAAIYDTRRDASSPSSPTGGPRWQLR